jgi:hypothetical protein
MRKHKSAAALGLVFLACGAMCAAQKPAGTFKDSKQLPDTRATKRLGELSGGAPVGE